MTKWYHTTIVGVLGGILIFIGQTTLAGTWVVPSGQPPVNNIDPIEVDGADGLGDHTATLDVLLEAKKIYNIGGAAGQWAVQATNTGAGTALTVGTGSGSGGIFRSGDNAAPAVTILSLSSDPQAMGLYAQSAGIRGAYFDKKVIVDAGDSVNGEVQLSVNSVDLLSLGAAAGQAADLYWGTRLLCDASETDCGHFSASSGDNLGLVDPHTAASDLSMNNFRIFDIHDADIPGVIVERALDVSSSGTGVGFNSYSDGWHGLELRATDNEAVVAGSNFKISSEPAALVSYNYGSGYGVWASSASGPAARLIGQLRLDTGGGVPPRLAYESSANALSTQSGSSNTATLYWGDKQLCNGSQADCGFSSGVPGYEFWVKEPNEFIYSDKLVSIGGYTKRSKLEVLVPSAPDFDYDNYDVEGGPGGDAKLVAVGDTVTGGQLVYALQVYSSGVVSSKIRIYRVIAPSTLVSNGGNYSVSLVGTYTVSSSITSTDLAVVGKYAFLTDTGAGTNLRVIDFTNPAAGTQVASLNWGTALNAPNSIYIKGRYAYIAEQAAFTVVDIGDPLDPKLIAHKTGGGWASLNGNTIQVVGRYAYTADAANGIRVIDINDPVNPVISGSYDFGADIVDDIDIRGNLLVATGVATGIKRLHFVDVKTAASPQLLRSLNLSRSLRGIQIAGNYIYGVSVSTDPSFTIIDIHDLAAPTVRTMATTFNGLDLLIIGSRALISGTFGDLTSLDISGTLAQGLDIGHLEVDTYNGNTLTAGDTLTVSGGAHVGGLLSLTSAPLTVKGKIIIGDYVLTEQLLQQLLTWCGGSC